MPAALLEKQPRQKAMASLLCQLSQDGQPHSPGGFRQGSTQAGQGSLQVVERWLVFPPPEQGLADLAL